MEDPMYNDDDADLIDQLSDEDVDDDYVVVDGDEDDDDKMMQDDGPTAASRNGERDPAVAVQHPQQPHQQPHQHPQHHVVNHHRHHPNPQQQLQLQQQLAAAAAGAGANPPEQMQPQPQPQSQQQQQQQPRRRGNRLVDLVDDEPPLRGYRRTEMIGQGAYGIVYRGTKEETGQTVAIKRIPFADSTPEGGVPCNVIREISLLRELDHPNVVKLLDIIQAAQPSGLYLVFEFVSHDLKSFMDQAQRSDDISERIGLPLPTVRSFLQQILAGVGCCHTHRILHRDLKPHNLLISGDGQCVKLADFGLARLSAIPNGPYTFEVVTLWYRAPELLLGANRYSTSVDVWSIGCIFAEMGSGIPLFPGRSDIDQIFKIFQRRGTPTATQWPSVTRLPHYNAEFPQWPERPITDFVRTSVLGMHGIDLLHELLAYDPDKRIACKTALQHPFFTHPE